jgi:lactate dehydrogenase-like 2-hydroxyacid dehydrogenase
MAALPALEIVANFGVGYDSVDVAAAAAKGIIVTNTPDVLTEEVADVALGLLLMAARELSASERFLRDGKWLGGPYPLTPGTLRGRTLGILGLGRIGQAIARRAEAFGLKVAYHNRREVPDSGLTYYPTLLALAEAVDTLMIVVPGGAATYHLVNADVLKALGPNGILINIGRGTTVDEAALVQALNDGTILAAGLDVFETEPCWPKELIDAPRAVLLPHVGSASVATRAAMGQLMVDNLASWFADGKPLTPVAETPWPKR